jgi:hypothetical protein
MNTRSTRQPVETGGQMPLEAANTLAGPATMALRRRNRRAPTPLEHTLPGLQHCPSAAIAHPHAAVPQAELFGLLLHYLNAHKDNQHLLSAARAVGEQYGVAAQLAGVSMQSAVEAFLPFRGVFTNLAMPMPGIAQPADLAPLSDLRARIDRFMDAALLGTIAGFENKRKGRC